MRPGTRLLCGALQALLALSLLFGCDASDASDDETANLSVSYDCDLESINDALKAKFSTGELDPKCAAAKEAGRYDGECSVVGGGFPDTYIMNGDVPLCFKPGTSEQVGGLNAGEVCAVACAPRDGMVQWDHGNTYFECSPLVVQGTHEVVAMANGCAQTSSGYGNDVCLAFYGEGSMPADEATDIVCEFSEGTGAAEM